MSRLEDALNKADQPTTAVVTPPAAEEPAVDVLKPLRAQPVEEIHISPALKTITTNFQLALADVERPVLALTSSVSGEGVSTLVYHLARILSIDRKTLVVDFNFLQPKLHKTFGVDNIRGLSDVLQGRKTLAECVTPVDQGNLHFLPCGPLVPAAFQLMNPVPVRNLIEQARRTYSVVLIDCPPLRKYPDCAILAAMCDGVVLVVRARKTKRQVVQYAQELLDKAGARQVGVILNRVKHYIPDFLYRRL